jgi:hypothetical protein
MPIPIPTDSENKTEYIRRCMSDEYMLDEFDDNGQRFAVCENTWSDSKYGTTPKPVQPDEVEED